MAKYEMGQEIEFSLSQAKEIGDVVCDRVNPDEVYYFEIVKVEGEKYTGKLAGINGYMKALSAENGWK